MHLVPGFLIYSRTWILGPGSSHAPGSWVLDLTMILVPGLLIYSHTWILGPESSHAPGPRMKYHVWYHAYLELRKW